MWNPALILTEISPLVASHKTRKPVEIQDFAYKKDKIIFRHDVSPHRTSQSTIHSMLTWRPCTIQVVTTDNKYTRILNSHKQWDLQCQPQWHRKMENKNGKRQIKVVATGHQAGIGADRNCNFSWDSHQFDVSHLSKSKPKQLIVRAKRKECAEIPPWIASTSNNLWFCAKTYQEHWEMLVVDIYCISHC